MAFDVDRVLSDPRELARHTGGPAVARRVCWTDEWLGARAFLRERLAELPVTVTVDAAGNLWADLPGATPKEEDTPEPDLRFAIQAFGRAVCTTVALARSGELPPHP